MARKFKKRPDLYMVVLPGVGRLERGQVIEGERFARFLGSHLVEVFDEPEPLPPPSIVIPLEDSLVEVEASVPEVEPVKEVKKLKGRPARRKEEGVSE